MSDKQATTNPQTAATPDKATTAAPKGGCCATSELATCCEPSDKAGCCGAPVVDEAPSGCGCR